MRRRKPQDPTQQPHAMLADTDRSIVCGKGRVPDGQRYEKRGTIRLQTEMEPGNPARIWQILHYFLIRDASSC